MEFHTPCVPCTTLHGWCSPMHYILYVDLFTRWVLHRWVEDLATVGQFLTHRSSLTPKLRSHILGMAHCYVMHRPTVVLHSTTIFSLDCILDSIEHSLRSSVSAGVIMMPQKCRFAHTSVVQSQIFFIATIAYTMLVDLLLIVLCFTNPCFCCALIQSNPSTLEVYDVYQKEIETLSHNMKDVLPQIMHADEGPNLLSIGTPLKHDFYAQI